MISLESLLLAGSLMVLVSIGLMRAFVNFGVPTLLLFVAVGMFAGGEGPWALHFQNYGAARDIGIVALILILFSGGQDISWKTVRPVSLQALSLSTVGVILTAIFAGIFAHYVLGLPPLHGLLLGAIISATDAAAVFSMLRSRRLNLKTNVAALLEVESGSNDPMGVFLTVTMLAYVQDPALSWWGAPLNFLREMGLGVFLGLVLGKAMVLTLNRVRFQVEGLYPVIGLAFAFLTYGLAEAVQGSGFLAVYLCGLVAGSSNVVHKRTLGRFFDGLGWLGQIGMFVILGLLVSPRGLMPMAAEGLGLSAFLIFLARPAAVFLSLAFSSLGWKEKIFISWVGLRGAAPIVLAIFPLLAGVSHAQTLFNLTFFMVLASTALQGWTLPIFARLLKVTQASDLHRKSPLEFAAPLDGDTELVEYSLPFGSTLAGKSVIELNLPEDALVVLVCRGEQFLVPSGGTILEEQDVIQVLMSQASMPKVREIFSKIEG